MTKKSDPVLIEAHPSADAKVGYKGVIGKTLPTSTPWWKPQHEAPKDAPNIILILLDDLGFSDFGCYGSEIQTPHINSLANDGLRFTGYTTIPMCTPARAAMMTGKNPHSVGAGWLTHSNPGYPGYQAGEIAKDAPTIAELLRQTGYSTYCVGKWHNTPDYKTSSASERDSWPLQRGFDRFYGFLGAETNYHSPGQLIEGNDYSRKEAYKANYFCTDDFTDRAISWMRAHRSACPDKPFYLYYASNAPHVPLHVKPEDLAKYKGKYKEGWDKLREARFRKQLEIGLLGKGWQLSPRSSEVPAWDDLPAESLELMSAYMELYAALVDNIDQNVGRLLKELDNLGIAENTLIMITSDNGASSIGGVEGAANIYEKRVTQIEDPNMATNMLQEGTLGGVDSSPAYPVGWGNASNTPFRFFKRTPMNGGIRVPLIMRWKAKIKDSGAIRSQWVHVTDILPTLLDVLGVKYPAQFNGYKTRGLNGVSFAQSLYEADVKTKRNQQYYELEGNRGYIHEGWKICSLQPKDTKINLDNWLLFNLNDDPTECHNLAATHREKLEEIIAHFEKDAETNSVYPLDNRGLTRSLIIPPFLEEKLNQTHIFYPHTETNNGYVVSKVVCDRNFELTCAFSWAKGQEGVLFAVGENAQGFASWIENEICYFAWRGRAHKKEIISFALSEGEQFLTLSHIARGKRKGEGTVTLESQGKISASKMVDMSPSMLRLTGEGLDVGLDRNLKVVPEYDKGHSFPYGGRIDYVKIVPGAMAPNSFVNRAERISQMD